MCLDMKSIIPATPLGVQQLIKRSGIDTFGKNAVVVGRSKNVGMPIAILLHSDGRNETNAMDATVTICHRFTPPKELAKFCQTADIIVSATGVPGLIRKDMIKPGACIIDVGLTRITDPCTGKHKLVGDVDYEGTFKFIIKKHKTNLIIFYYRGTSSSRCNYSCSRWSWPHDCGHGNAQYNFGCKTPKRDTNKN